LTQIEEEEREDQARLEQDRQQAIVFNEKEAKAKQTKKQNYQKMFKEFVDQKNEIAQKKKNSILPLEYKVNKQKLEQLGYSPEKNNLTIVGKF
jgi:hypothetical protein